MSSEAPTLDLMVARVSGAEVTPEMVREAQRSTLAGYGARFLSDIDRDAPPPLLHGRISPDGHTILYGPPGSMKGTLSSYWAVLHALSGGRVLIIDFEDHPEEWARRVWGLGGTPVWDDAIIHVSPYRQGKVDWSRLHALARAHQATLVIVDSLAYAVQGDPSDPLTATGYSANIQPFGIPVLSLAHMNRAGDERYPFGSVFWHAGARVTWSLVADGDNGSKLQNRKANNYEWQGSYMVTADWRDGIPYNVNERPYAVSVSERIAAILPADLDGIVGTLNDGSGPEVRRNTVVQALNRGVRGQRWTVDSEGVWSVREDHDR